MKVFLDANILVSVLNKEYPVFAYSARIMSLADNRNFKLFTSPVCLAIAYYFCEKKSGKKEARRKIGILSKHLTYTTINQQTVETVLSNPKVLDLEDGMQYYSALGSDCRVIITENQSDYYFSEVEVLSSRRFFEKYMY